MPHLRVEINKPTTEQIDIEIARRLKALFSEVMDTGVDHIAITITNHKTYSLDLGRVIDHKRGVALIDADIREGRTLEQRRQLALGFIKILNDLLQIPEEHMYVTLTEHKGEDFHLNERFLQSWAQGDDPLA